MKVVIAIDSLKGSLTSMEAGNAAREGVLRACEASVVVKPLADGGEGTMEALVDGLGGNYVHVSVKNPMGKSVTAAYGVLGNQASSAAQAARGGQTAVMEMAQAAGITLVDANELDPWKTTTTGVGEMILDAVSRGCRKFIIGIGGSATTEGGIGMLQSLGYTFYDADGNKLPPVFGSLGKIESISAEHVPGILRECRFQIACDVTNPLCGEHGAVYVYGPQKGVKEDEKEKMDDAMRHFAKKTAEFSGVDHSLLPGAGASGGLGFAFVSYLPNAELKPGIAVVLEAVGLERELWDADIVITGEGRMDAQTAMGKAPAGVARLAKKYHCMTVAFAGSVAEDAGICNEAGIDAYFPIVRGVTSLEEAMDAGMAKKNMMLATEQVFRLLSRTKCRC